ncbi:uncharacterized protein LOC144383488 [Gasterosteus aculeatus]
MVTFRTGSRGDPDVSIGPHRKNPKPGTRRRDAREETPGLSHPSQGTNAEEEERDPDGSGRKVEDDGRAVAASIRKSQRRQNAAGGGGRSGLRRSSRPVNPVSRYQTSGRSVSSRADASVLKKRLVNDVDSKSYSEVRKRRRTEEPPQVDISSFEKGGLVDEDRKQEAAAEDNSCGTADLRSVPRLQSPRGINPALCCAAFVPAQRKPHLMFSC